MTEQSESWDDKSGDWFPKFYFNHHGLHVFEDKFVKDCPLCQQRAAIQVMARFEGRDPEKAVSDATYAREITRDLTAKGEKKEENNGKS